MSAPYVEPYAVLGLTRTATAADIKQAYFTLVRAHPPEREPEMFKRIRAAYERLRDPEQRLETDMLLLTAWPEPERKRRAPQPDVTLHHEDVLAAARSLSELERRDWSEHYGKVQV
jgi:curved DNA-binding protein CbpA